MKLTIRIDKTTATPPTPATGLWFVNHDLVPRGSVGLPETNKCLTDRMFRVSPQLMELIRRVLRLMHPSMSDATFESNLRLLYKNNAGFSNQTGMESEEFKIENVYCGGATFRQVSGEIKVYGGKRWLEVYCLDPAHLPPLPKTLAEIDMTKWFFPTTAPAAPIYNRSNPFPIFGGRCIVPFLGVDGRNYINFDNFDRPNDDIGLVKVDTIQNPFLPARLDVTVGLINPFPLPVLKHDFQVPASGNFAQLRHDFENPEWEYRPRSYGLNPESPNAALPETVHLNPFLKEDFVPLTEEMQWFHFALLAKANPTLTMDELKARWRALTVNSVAFTDGHSIDYGTRFFNGDPSKNYKDYILQENMSNPIPIAWKALSTGGNIVKIIEAPATIEAIDFTKPLPSIDEVWQKPWLIHWATEETINELPMTVVTDGSTRKTWSVGPFPQMRPVGTPFPIWGREGRNRVSSVTSLKPIGNGTTFSPYFP